MGRHNYLNYHLRVFIILLFTLAYQQNTSAQGIDFTPSGLTVPSLVNPTSLQFGPDGRLYVSQQYGIIYAYTIERQGASNYVVTNTETINLIKNQTPNYDDDGTYNNTKNRQITGIFVAGTAEVPILYVSSSDWRIGAGGGGNDLNLDTNSGILHRLTKNGGSWDKVDLVRGLPRSEENHAVNGMVIDPYDPDVMYLTVGGSTNAGSPSNNFAFHTEYAYAACIVKIDLAAINDMTIKSTTEFGYTYKWIYDLPTVDDPTRENISGEDGYTDNNDPFGGNDGLNQAKIDPDSPVQIHSPGWRNVYDVIITTTAGREGRMYAVDNGANGGWGGHPDGEADYPAETKTALVTNKYVTGEPGSTNIGPGGDPAVNNKNGLHYIRPLVSGDLNYVADDPFNNQIYYAGHPTPIRGNPAGAGLYTKGEHTLNPDDGTDAYWRHEILDESDPNFASESLPLDWPPVPLSMANPAEGDFRNSGETDGAIANYDPSTNGLCEYTASNFEGALKGNLLLAGYDGSGPIFRAILSDDGKIVTNCPDLPANCDKTFATGFGSQPLDVVAQGDDDIFPGTVWAVTYGADKITVFEPADFQGGTYSCEATYSYDIDSDNDGYTDADEIDNGTDPCSGAEVPDDFDKTKIDGFLVSNINDDDDDDDGLLDIDDAFQWDADNGKTTSLPYNNDLFNALGYGFGDIGFTGLMANGSTDYHDQFNSGETIFGGTAGLFTVQTTTGDVTTNNQNNGFQFGINVGTSTGTFIVKSKINAPFFNNNTPQNYQSEGIFIGTGDQNNYIKLVLAANSGNGGFEVYYEDGGTKQTSSSPFVSGLLDKTEIELVFEVDPVAGTVQPKYSLDKVNYLNAGPLVTLTGNVLKAVQGTYAIDGVASALAVGTISTSYGGNPSFAATWDYFQVEVSGSSGTSISVESIADQFNAEGEEPDLTVVASGGDANLVYEAEGLPLGLDIEPTNGHIFGTIASNAAEGGDNGDGVYNVEITVGDGGINTPVKIEFEWTITTEFDAVWTNITNNNEHIPRHENAFLQAGDKFYLMGGRESDVVNIYNYSTKTWTKGASAPISINHFQPVAYQGLIWAVCGFKDNNFPNETPAEYIYIYNPVSDEWIQGAEIPESRRRGSSGVVVYNNKFYIVGGIQDGHSSGWVTWLDEYDPATDTWRQLANAPRARDHFHATLHGNKIYLAGGRRSGEETTFAPTIPEVDVFDLSTESWLTGSSLPDDLPTPRAGASSVNYKGELMVIGGEGNGQAYARVDALNITTGVWTRLADLNHARHGTGAIVSGGGVFITSGSPIQGGGTMTNMEFYGTNNPQGTAITKGTLTGPAAYDFEGNTGNATITINNSGGSQGLFITSVELGGVDQSDFSITNQSELDEVYLLSSGASLSIIVNFNPSDTDIKSATLTVTTLDGQSIEVALSGGEIITADPIVIEQLATQNNTEGDAISLSVVARGGTGDLIYSAENLPLGISINDNSGEITGTLQDGSNGSYTVTVTVEDSEGVQEEMTFTWNVSTKPVELSSVANQVNDEGDVISVQIIANGGSGTYNYEATGLPSGITLDTDNGLITGTIASGAASAVANGMYTIVVSVSDGAGGSDEISFTWKVNNPFTNFAPSIDQQDDLNVTAAASYDFDVNVKDEDFDALNISVSSGDVSFVDYIITNNEDGTYQIHFSLLPTFTDLGNYTITITASDGNGDPVEMSFDINVEVVEPEAGQILYRINAGGDEVKATDNSNVDWMKDTNDDPAAFRVSNGGENILLGSSTDAYSGDISYSHASLSGLNIPESIFEAERWDAYSEPNMNWEFPVYPGTEVLVRLYFAELFNEIDTAGQRVFDIALEGEVPLAFSNIDQFAIAGAKGAFMLQAITTVSEDSILDISFLHKELENPAIKGIEVMVYDNRSINMPPVITFIDDTISVIEGENLLANISYTDEDNPEIYMSAVNTVTGDTILLDEYIQKNGAQKAVLNWATQVGDRGKYLITVTLSDGVTTLVHDYIYADVQTSLANILGKVNLQGRQSAPNNSWAEPLQVDVYEQGELKQLVSYSTISSDSGTFYIEDLVRGDYLLSVKQPHTLKNAMVANLVRGDNLLHFGTLKEGDADNNNEVNEEDYSILKSTFGYTSTEEGFIDSADFNTDNTIDIIDFSLLSSNYNTTGYAVTDSSFEKLALVDVDTSFIPFVQTENVELLVKDLPTIISLNDEIEATIELQTGSQSVDGVETILSYDPEVLQVLSIEDAGGFTETLMEEIDNDKGEVKFAAGILADSISGNIELYTVKARVIQQPETTDISFANESILSLAGNSITFESEVTTFAISAKPIGFVVYPNPASDIVKFEFLNPEQAEIRVDIYDTMGKKVYGDRFDSSNQYDYQVNLSNMSSGIFITKVRIGKKIMVKKVAIK